MGRAKRKAEDVPLVGSARDYAVKCSLGRLLVAPGSLAPDVDSLSSKLREQIEVAVHCCHALVVKGSLVATEAVLSAARRGEPLPDVHVQSWWYKCFTSCGSLKGKRGACKDALIETSAQALFGISQSWTPMDHMWPFMAEMARDAITTFQNMMASNFHVQLTKAFRREVVLWEHMHSAKLEKRVVYRIVNHYLRDVTGHQNATVLDPSEVPPELSEHLGALVQRWKTDFAEVLPCPDSSFIYKLAGKDCAKLRTYVQWLYQLQVHRAACVQQLQQRLGPESTRPADTWFKASARPLGMLPVYSHLVKHIAISPTGAKSLLKGAGVKEDVDFKDCFPGMARFHRADKRESQSYIRTDGVSASLVMRSYLGRVLPKRSKKGGEEGPRPVCPLPGQRLVAIDPGRREMISAVTPEDGWNEGFKVSTKAFRHEAGTKATASLTRRLQKGTCCSDGENLHGKLGALPSRRNIDTWGEYLKALLPILDVVLEVRQRRCLRRRALRGYALRDSALDRVCKKITAGQPTLVAFGAANSCSTGFGHAPAPQGRLRHRLSTVHRATVCLIDEFRTSRVCCRCNGGAGDAGRGEELQHASASKIGKDGRVHSVKLHHVLFCTSCVNSKGSKQFWHRDYNAAKNILACYLAEAQGHERPVAFRRKHI